MQYNIFAQRDATLYEIYPTRNTGRDAILELTKIACGSLYEGNAYGVNYNSRPIIVFDLSEISASVVNGTISSNARYYLNLRCAESSELPYNYTLYAYPVSRSWEAGYGNYSSTPPITEDVSWTYRVNRGGVQNTWRTAGGDYYTFVPSSSISSSLSQSFSYSQVTATTPGNFSLVNTGADYLLTSTPFEVYVVATSASAHTQLLSQYVWTNTSSAATTLDIQYTAPITLSSGSPNDTYKIYVYDSSSAFWLNYNTSFGTINAGISIATVENNNLSAALQNFGFSRVSEPSNTNTIFFTSSILTPSSSINSQTGSGTPIASQSFAFADPDIRMDVTNIVKLWLSGSIPNNGFIVKRSDTDETSGEILGSLKFFSTDTNTIYIPKLEAVWDDSTFNTGSLTEINDDNMVIYFKNLQAYYREASNVKLRMGVRPAYPALTYSTSSNYLINYYLPSSSYYSVKDTVTEETIIPFDTNYTKVSCDSNGSYINLKLNTFLPERFYRIIIKTVQDGGDRTLIHDNGYYFKVVR